jgi:tRNA G18 (ribose-2'-O)-methylase SpoU
VVVEGVLAVERALLAGADVEVVLATEATAARLPPLPLGVQGRLASAEQVREIVGYDFHRGCLATVRRRAEPALTPTLAAWLSSSPAPWVVVAEALADPVNVGALLRNARAFGVAGVVFVGGADPWAPRAIRASAGHVFSQPWTRARSCDAVFDAATASAASPRHWAATVGTGAMDVATVPGGPALLWVGSEGPGLSPQMLARADGRLTIPMAADVDSLNVAAATAVMLYALRGGGAQPS